MKYSLMQWLFFFYIYSFAGWCVESAFVSIRTRKLTNRGFMRGPFLPLYGSGGIMMLVVSWPFQDHIFLTYAAGCVGATVLEYVTGVAMEMLFKVRYWDYSKKPFNFQGHICLRSTLAWGFLTIFMTEVIHVPVERLAFSLSGRPLTALTYALTIWIAADFALSFKAAIDIRNVLVRMEQAKREMLHILGRLDVILSLAGQKGEWVEGMSMRIEDVRSGIEGRLETVKNLVLTKPVEYFGGMKEELLELGTRYAVNAADRTRLGKIRDFFQRDMIRSNPDMKSVEYDEAFEELKHGMAGEEEEDEA